MSRVSNKLHPNVVPVCSVYTASSNDPAFFLLTWFFKNYIPYINIYIFKFEGSLEFRQKYWSVLLTVVIYSKWTECIPCGPKSSLCNCTGEIDGIAICVLALLESTWAPQMRHLTVHHGSMSVSTSVWPVRALLTQQSAFHIQLDSMHHEPISSSHWTVRPKIVPKMKRQTTTTVAATATADTTTYTTITTYLREQLNIAVPQVNINVITVSWSCISRSQCSSG